MSAFPLGGQVHLPSSLKTISSDDLAGILGVSVDTLYNRATRTPHLLPPSLKIGGKRRYRVVDVEAWLLKQLQVPQVPGAPAPSSSTSPATTTIKRRGRPPKPAVVKRPAMGQGVGNG
ncbi:helix-turn-helix domain-containing protein [Oryzomicrobium sp.]|uniref:helix-turn-helix domain-containing protein n=1 Tax=Oryzomicrobium sp. TaxID=1911578 RepID=UPI003FA6FDBC